MQKPTHTAIYTDNRSEKSLFARQLLKGTPPVELQFLQGLKGELFSNTRIAEFLQEEAIHEFSGLTLPGERKLASFSSGERKKALLKHIMAADPDYLILDNPFDNLDREFREVLKNDLLSLSEKKVLIQFISRSADKLACIGQSCFLDGNTLTGFPDYRPSGQAISAFEGNIPPPLQPMESLPRVLVSFKRVNLSYHGQPILQRINWDIKQGEFWELRGANGSGKTSLITMITGENPKAYGQNIELFGRPKGTGESIWEIKAKIGYFTPAVTDRFRGNHSLENMLISGFTDSIGLYVKPSDLQVQRAGKWLKLLGWFPRRNEAFRSLSEGEKRLLLCARAMVKHPPLLILDEPTAGLDDTAAAWVTALVNKMAAQSNTAIVFVSHRAEPGLSGQHIFELIPSPKGSEGRQIS